MVVWGVCASFCSLQGRLLALSKNALKSVFSGNTVDCSQSLGIPVIPFCILLPFLFWVSLLKLNSRRKGTHIINGLLGNLDPKGKSSCWFSRRADFGPTRLWQGFFEEGQCWRRRIGTHTHTHILTHTHIFAMFALAVKS